MKWTAGSNASPNASTGATITAAWHHIAIVQSGSGASNRRYVYVDGVDNTSGTPAADDGSGAGAVYLGRGSTSEYFAGGIDDVRVYNRALAASDIALLAAGGQPTTSLGTETMTGSPTIAGDLVTESETLAIGSNTVNVAGNWYTYGGQLSVDFAYPA